ncbi:hypothetical protein B5S32_g1878 [[Candida] boidinii]|nr:hypothetical protein B5S32_g1878 [[Candida] boidinii]
MFNTTSKDFQNKEKDRESTSFQDTESKDLSSSSSVSWCSCLRKYTNNSYNHNKGDNNNNRNLISAQEKGMRCLNDFMNWIYFDPKTFAQRQNINDNEKEKYLQIKNLKNYQVFNSSNYVFLFGGRFMFLKFKTKKKNGKVTTNDYLLLVSIFVFTLPFILFLIFEAKWNWNNVSPAVVIIMCYLWLILVQQFIKAAFTDPGVLPRNIHVVDNIQQYGNPPEYNQIISLPGPNKVDFKKSGIDFGGGGGIGGGIGGNIGGIDWHIGGGANGGFGGHIGKDKDGGKNRNRDDKKNKKDKDNKKSKKKKVDNHKDKHDNDKNGKNKKENNDKKDKGVRKDKDKNDKKDGKGKEQEKVADIASFKSHSSSADRSLSAEQYVNTSDSATTQIVSDLKYCNSCKIWRPYRSTHCSRCNMCILNQDHHCLWLNNCVGQRNYFNFISFVTVSIIIAFYMIGLLVNHFIKYKAHENSIRIKNNLPEMNNREIFKKIPMTLFILIFCLIVVLWPILLWLYHFIIGIYGVSTRETIYFQYEDTGEKISYLKLFSKIRNNKFNSGNPVKNLIDSWFRPQGVDLINLRDNYIDGDLRFKTLNFGEVLHNL